MHGNTQLLICVCVYVQRIKLTCAVAITSAKSEQYIILTTNYNTMFVFFFFWQ